MIRRTPSRRRPLTPSPRPTSTAPVLVLLDRTHISRRPLDIKDVRAFEYVKTIGESHYGSIQLCRNPDNGGYVAVKVIHRAKVRIAQRHKRILQEVHIMRILQPHPNVIEFLGTAKTKQNIYVCLEACVVGDLFGLLTEQRTLPEPQTRYCISHIANALEHLHCNYVVHRDVKPENIVLHNDGRLKLIDLGYSKIVYDRTQSMLGTISYMAPAIVKGMAYAHEVDVWALGVLAYECLSGRTPFYDADEHVEMKKIVHGSYELIPETSTAATQFMSSALEPNMELRMQTASCARRHSWISNARDMKPLKLPSFKTVHARFNYVDNAPWQVCEEDAYVGDLEWDRFL